jgi:crotonobetaine/carnitine-CoA ligase
VTAYPDADPALDIEELLRWRVVPDRLRHWARTDPDRPFFRCAGDWWTFGATDRVTDAVAGGLAGHGVRRGDRVAIVLPNHEDYVLAVFALAKLGAVQVPVNVFLKGGFLRHQLVDAGVSVVIGDAAGLAEVRRIADQLPALRLLVGVGPDAEADVGFAELRDSGRTFEAVPIAPRDPLAIMYTSGTTGASKGCLLSHGYFMFLPRGWFTNGWYRAGEHICTAAPLFHIAGQGMQLMCALLAGLRVTFLPAFSASGFIDACRAAGATAAFGVGPMGMAVLATPERPDDTDHDLRISIFPPMPHEARDRWRVRFGTPVVSDAYGQTECNPIAQSPVDRQGPTPRSLGRPAPWLDVRLVDDQENEVPRGEPGEVVIRPREPMVMFDGYWNNPAATVAASRDLWHHTGDTARLDEHGYLVFFDRKSDSVRRRGENISCAEVEAAILDHPDVAAVAAHAVPALLGDDDLKVWIVPADGVALEPATLHAWLVDSLPYYAVPRYVERLDGLPVNALGRVQKFRLRERDNAGAWDFEALGLTVPVERRRRRGAGARSEGRG